MNVYLKKIDENDWRDLKKIRLQSIKDYPTYFAPSTDESKAEDHYWKERLRNPNRCIWLLYSNEEVIGLTGAILKSDDIKTCCMVMTYINPQFQNLKYSKLFYQARLEWAKQMNCEKLLLTHAVDNYKIKKIHESYGFHFHEAYLHVYHDGREEMCETYIKKLNR